MTKLISVNNKNAASVLASINIVDQKAQFGLVLELAYSNAIKIVAPSVELLNDCAAKVLASGDLTQLVKYTAARFDGLGFDKVALEFDFVDGRGAQQKDGVWSGKQAQYTWYNWVAPKNTGAKVNRYTRALTSAIRAFEGDAVTYSNDVECTYAPIAQAKMAKLLKEMQKEIAQLEAGITPRSMQPKAEKKVAAPAPAQPSNVASIAA